MNKDFIHYYFGGRSIGKTANLKWARNPDAVRTIQPDLQKIKLGVHKRYRKAPPPKLKFDLNLTIKIDGNNLHCKSKKYSRCLGF